VTTAARLETNRRNAQSSTGPRTAAGKAVSRQNAVKHGLSSRLAVAIPSGPFLEDAEEVQQFVEQVVAELDPQTAQEQAEALSIAGLYVRRRRLVEFETLALARSTEARIVRMPEGPSVITQPELERAGAAALTSDLLDRLPRYEAHLSRELDRSLARYRRLQGEREAKESAVLGEVVAGQRGPV
jgi:hypothetical protein